MNASCKLTKERTYASSCRDKPVEERCTTHDGAQVLATKRGYRACRDKPALKGRKQNRSRDAAEDTGQKQDRQGGNKK